MLSIEQIEQPLPVTLFDLWYYAVGRTCGEMVIEMELGFQGRLDERLLALSADLLLDAEPVLGCRLAVDDPRPRWQQVPRRDRRRLVVARVRDEYEGIRRTGLDPTANVQVELCLWHSEDGDRLLVKMTHEVGDGVGLQLLMARLSAIYSGLCTDPAFRPQPNREARGGFDQVLAQVPGRTRLGTLWDFFKFMAPRWFPRSTHVLAVPGESVESWVPVIKRVPATRLSFLSTYGKARGATLNDVFLAAAYRAFASRGRWDGVSGLRIAITVDLRRWCLPQTHARSICNLSSLDYPFLIRDLGRNFDETLANVTTLTRRRKKSRPGLAFALVGHFLMKRDGHAGLLRAGAKERGARERRTVWQEVSLVLSNEGPLEKAHLCFGSVCPVFAHTLPPFLASGVHISVSGYNGALTLAAVTAQRSHAAIESFLEALLEQLPIEAVGPGSPQPDWSTATASRAALAAT